MSKGKNDSHPIYSMVANFVRSLVKANAALVAAVNAAEAQIATETDAFVRNGNRTDYNRDGLAFSSARIEPLKGSPGLKAFTYSTMEGRRVDDILYEVLLDISGEVYEPTDRKDGKTNHRQAERAKWIMSLGYQRVEAGKGKRGLFGDTFVELKDQLEKSIPERFTGTQKPSTQLQQVPMVAPPTLHSRTFYTNVYRPSVASTPEGEKKILICAMELEAAVKAGFRFLTDESGNVRGEIASFYADLILKGIKSNEPSSEVVEVVEQPEQAEQVEQAV